MLWVPIGTKVPGTRPYDRPLAWVGLKGEHRHIN